MDPTNNIISSVCNDKMEWTAKDDKQLLSIVLNSGVNITEKEYAAIGAMFPARPSAKAVQERLAKLRRAQRRSEWRMEKEAEREELEERRQQREEDDEKEAKRKELEERKLQREDDDEWVLVER